MAIADDQSDVVAAERKGLKLLTGWNLDAVSSFLFESQSEYVIAIRAHRYIRIYLIDTNQGKYIEAGELLVARSPKSLGIPAGGLTGNVFTINYPSPKTQLDIADKTYIFVEPQTMKEMYDGSALALQLRDLESLPENERDIEAIAALKAKRLAMNAEQRARITEQQSKNRAGDARRAAAQAEMPTFVNRVRTQVKITKSF